MARVILETPNGAANGDDITVGGAFNGFGDTSDVNVIGTAATQEEITVTRGDIVLNNFPGGDVIRLPGEADEYTAQLVGSRVILVSTINQVRISIPVSTVGNTIIFGGDDARTIIIMNGQVMIDDEVVDGTPDFLEGIRETQLSLALTALRAAEAAYQDYLRDNDVMDEDGDGDIDADDADQAADECEMHLAEARALQTDSQLLAEVNEEQADVEAARLRLERAEEDYTPALAAEYAELAALEAAVIEEQQDVDEAELRLAIAEARVAEEEADVAAEEADVAAAQAVVDQEEIDVANAEADVAQEEADVAAAEADVAQEEADVAAAEAVVAQEEADVAEEQADVDAAQAVVDAEQQDVNEAQAAYDQALIEYNAALANYNAEAADAAAAEAAFNQETAEAIAAEQFYEANNAGSQLAIQGGDNAATPDYVEVFGDAIIDNRGDADPANDVTILVRDPMTNDLVLAPGITEGTNPGATALAEEFNEYEDAYNVMIDEQAEEQAALVVLNQETADLAAAQANLTAEQAELTAAQAALAVEQAQLTEEQNELALAEAALAAEEAELAAAESNLATQQAQLAIAQAELQDQQAELAAAQAVLAVQEAQLAEEQAELAAAEAEREAAEDNLAVQEDQLADAIAARDAQQEVVDDMDPGGLFLQEYNDALANLAVQEEQLREAIEAWEERQAMIAECEELRDIADEAARLEGIRDDRMDDVTALGFENVEVVDDLENDEQATAGDDAFVFVGEYGVSEYYVINGFGDQGDDVLFVGEGYNIVYLAEGVEVGADEVGNPNALEIFVQQQDGDTVLFFEELPFGGNVTQGGFNGDIIVLTDTLASDVDLSNLGFITTDPLFGA